jgi:hypothetical protein
MQNNSRNKISFYVILDKLEIKRLEDSSQKQLPLQD